VDGAGAPADVEDLGWAGGDDPADGGVAGQTAGGVAGDRSEVAEPGGGGTGPGLQGVQCHGDGEVGAFTGDLGSGAGIQVLVADFDEGVVAALGWGAGVAGAGGAGGGFDGGEDCFGAFYLAGAGDVDVPAEGAGHIQGAGGVTGSFVGEGLLGVQGVCPAVGGAGQGVGGGRDRYLEQVGFGLGHAAGVVLVGELGPLGGDGPAQYSRVGQGDVAVAQCLCGGR